MNTHIRIFIDASGSMGKMQGSTDEGKYLLPDKSTRMSLVKRILCEDVLPSLNYIDLIGIYTFRTSKRSVFKNDKHITEDFVEINAINNTKLTTDILIQRINKIKDPAIGGTPMYSIFRQKLDFLKLDNGYQKSILLITDGDSNDEVKFDEKILEYMLTNDIMCSIYILGVAQNSEAQRKSKNLAAKTNGKYINIEAADYDKHYVSEMLFELKSNILSSSLKSLFNSSDYKDDLNFTLHSSEDITVKENLIIEKKQEEKSSAKESNNFNIEEVIKNNSIALNIIGKQLHMITEVMKYRNLDKDIDENQDPQIDDNSELNKQIGFKAEKILFDYLQKNNLDNLIWNNEHRESYKPFDMQYNLNNKINYIECKGSVKAENYFYLTKAEWTFFLDNRNNYKLCYVSEVDNHPKIKIIENLLDAILDNSVVPYSFDNRNIKAERIFFTILK